MTKTGFKNLTAKINWINYKNYVSEGIPDGKRTRKSTFYRRKIRKRNFIRRKKWEIRTKRTSIRGKIYLLSKSKGEILGSVEIIDAKGPFTTKELEKL